MKRLAWVEILNSQGDVSNRHPVYAWPVNVGRAYHNDVILDDPYVAAGHLEIQPLEAGGYQLNTLGDVKGVTLNRQRKPHTMTQVTAEDVIHIGRNQLRIRPVDYVVSPAQTPPKWARLRSGLGLSVGLLLLLFEYALSRWLSYDREEKNTILLAEHVGFHSLELGFYVGGFLGIGRAHRSGTDELGSARHLSLIGSWVAYAHRRYVKLHTIRTQFFLADLSDAHGTYSFPVWFYYLSAYLFGQPRQSSQNWIFSGGFDPAKHQCVGFKKSMA